jgi:hypothetical protein
VPPRHAADERQYLPPLQQPQLPDWYVCPIQGLRDKMTA